MVEESKKLAQNTVLNEAVANNLLKNDAALSRLLGVPQSYITNVRAGRQPLGSSLKLKLIEKAGMTIKQINKIMEVSK